MNKTSKAIKSVYYWTIIAAGLGIPTSSIFAAKPPVFSNPLTKSAKSLSIGHVVANFVQGVLSLAGVIAVVYVIIGGIRIAFAAGNEQNIAKGKKTLVYAILGLLVAFGGFMLVDIILNAASQILNLG